MHDSGLELMGLVALSVEASPRFAGCPFLVYMDSRNFPSAVTKGDSDADAIAVLCGFLWDILQRCHIIVWFPRVPSGRNPADLPTRNWRPSYKHRYPRTSKAIPKMYRSALTNLRKLSPIACRRPIREKVRPWWAAKHGCLQRWCFPGSHLGGTPQVYARDS